MQKICILIDFFNILWANGVRENSIEDIRGYFLRREAVPEAMHEKMLELFREYIVVGGMPRVVHEFVTSHNFAKVYRLQKGILSDYVDDIAKYAEGTEKTKARACFLSIPKHLAKDYKKFRTGAASGGKCKKRCIQGLHEGYRTTDGYDGGGVRRGYYGR